MPHGFKKYLWAAVQTQDEVPEAVRLFDELDYRAVSLPHAWRVLLKAEVMALGQNSRFINFAPRNPGLQEEE